MTGIRRPAPAFRRRDKPGRPCGGAGRLARMEGSKDGSPRLRDLRFARFVSVDRGLHQQGFRLPVHRHDQRGRAPAIRNGRAGHPSQRNPGRPVIHFLDLAPVSSLSRGGPVGVFGKNCAGRYAAGRFGNRADGRLPSPFLRRFAK